MGLSATTTAARIEGAVALDLGVAEATQLAPWLRELRLEGDLTGFSPWPGQDLMVLVPPDGDPQRWRRYTVRRFDADAGWVDLWITTTCDGPGATWARTTDVGDRVEAVGPRGKIGLDATARTHLFIVDDAGLAAMCAMAEALEPPAAVSTLLPLPPTPGDESTSVLLPVTAEDVASSHHLLEVDDRAWLEQVVAITVKPLDPADTAAYVFGELALTRAVTAQLTVLGLDPARVASKAYWRGDRPNAERGEPDRDGASE